MVQFVRNCDIPEPPECIVTVPPFKPITPNISDIPHEFPTALVTKLLPCNKKDRFPCPDFVIDNEDCLNTEKLDSDFLAFQQGDSEIDLDYYADWEASVTINLDMEAHCCDDDSEDHDEVVVSPVIDIDLPVIKIPCTTMRFEDTVITQSQDGTTALEFTVDITPDTCSELVVTPSLTLPQAPEPCITVAIGRLYLLSRNAYNTVFLARYANDKSKIKQSEFIQIRNASTSASDLIWFVYIADPLDYSNNDPTQWYRQQYLVPLNSYKDYYYREEGDYAAVQLDICELEATELDTDSDKYQPVTGTIAGDCNNSYMNVTGPDRFAGNYDLFNPLADPVIGMTVNGILNISNQKVYANIPSASEEVTTFNGILLGLALPWTPGPVVQCSFGSGSAFPFIDATVVPTASRIGVALPPGTPVTVEIHHTPCAGAKQSILTDYSLPMFTATLIDTISAGGTGMAQINMPFNGGSTLQVTNQTISCQEVGAKGFVAWTGSQWSFFAYSSSEESEEPEPNEEEPVSGEETEGSEESSSESESSEPEYDLLDRCGQKIFDVTPGKQIYVTDLTGWDRCKAQNDVGGEPLTDDEKSLSVFSDNYSSIIDVDEHGTATLTEVDVRVATTSSVSGHMFWEHELTGNIYNYDLAAVDIHNSDICNNVILKAGSYDTGDGLITSLSDTRISYDISYTEDGATVNKTLDMPVYRYNEDMVFNAYPGSDSGSDCIFKNTGDNWVVGKLGDPCATNVATVTRASRSSSNINYGIVTWSSSTITLRYNPLFNDFEEDAVAYKRIIDPAWLVPFSCCDALSVECYRKYGHYDIEDIPRNASVGDTYTWEPEFSASDITITDFQTGSRDQLNRIYKTRSLEDSSQNRWIIDPSDLSCCLGEELYSVKPFQWEYAPESGTNVFDAEWVFVHSLVAVNNAFQARPIDFITGNRHEMMEKGIFKQYNGDMVLVERTAYGMDGGVKSPIFHWKPNDQRAITTEYQFRYYSKTQRKFTNTVKKFKLQNKPHYPIVYDNTLNEYVLRYGDASAGYYVYDREANTGCAIDQTYIWTCEDEPLADKRMTFPQFKSTNYTISKIGTDYIINPNKSQIHYWVANPATKALFDQTITFKGVTALKPITLTCSIDSNSTIKGYVWILDRS